MKTYTLEDFCTEHGAVQESQDLGLPLHYPIQEIWEKAPHLWLIWAATRPGVLTDQELRLFAVWSARQVQHLMTDPRSVAALDVAERYANGQATESDLSEAWDAAEKACRKAPLGSSEDASMHAAKAFAATAAMAAAQVSTVDAVREASRNAAWAASRGGSAQEDALPLVFARGLVTFVAATNAQAKYLRKNTSPKFNTHKQ